MIKEILLSNPSIINDLGENLYEKITKVVTPEWQAAFEPLTKQGED